MEILVFSVFCASLLACILLDASILYALGVGLLLFVGCAWKRGFRMREIERLSRHITPFGGVVATSAVTALISCNQTLAAILTHQLCGEMIPTPEELALSLENSVIVMAALVPWSIASAVPLTSIGASGTSIPYAFFLYLLPLCRLADSIVKKTNPSERTH